MRRMSRPPAAGNEDGALERLEDALLAAAPFGLRGPFLAEPELAVPLARLVERGTAAPAFALDLMWPAGRRRPGIVGPPDHRRAPHRTGVHDAALPRERVVERRDRRGALRVREHRETHQRAVYRKLGAVGRRDAVRRARVLAL